MNVTPASTAPTTAARWGLVSTDAVTALIFLWTWIAPGSTFFADAESMQLVFVLEFASLHAAGMLAVFIVSERMRPWQRFAGIAAIGALYVAFFARLGILAGIWWPAGVMAVFLFSKVRHALFHPRGDDHEFHYGIQWGVSTGLFVLLTGVAFALPWPYLGIEPGPDDGKKLADGATVAGAHTLVVAGFLYFSVIAAIKYRWAGFFIAQRA